VTKREIILCKDGDELNRKAAAQFTALASAAIARSGRFAVALSGGSTPKSLYSLLASPDFRDLIDWSRVHLFWGDERCVPPDHPDSNFRMVREALLAEIQIPDKNIHRMLGETEPGEAAAVYEAELKTFLGLEHGGWPRFDLIFLGLGEDGHTASLFPGTDAANEAEHLVAVAYVERLQSYRLTLTLPVINAAAQVTFLVSGETKAAIVKEILLADSASCNYPAAKVRPMHGGLSWVIGADAAKELPLSIITGIGVLE
jgi:6-phosphogluconolactonase